MTSFNFPSGDLTLDSCYILHSCSILIWLTWPISLHTSKHLQYHVLLFFQSISNHFSDLNHSLHPTNWFNDYCKVLQWTYLMPPPFQKGFVQLSPWYKMDEPWTYCNCSYRQGKTWYKKHLKGVVLHATVLRHNMSTVHVDKDSIFTLSITVNVLKTKCEITGCSKLNHAALINYWLKCSASDTLNNPKDEQ